ncbi:MAG: AzlD domain-containing protein [Actinomycetota bacterium]
MTTWIAILAVGAGSYAFRSGPLVLVAERGLRPQLQRMLGFVGPAVLGAILVSSLFVSGGSATWPGVASLAAVVVAFVAVRRTGNVAHALLAGLPVFWVVTPLVG